MKQEGYLNLLYTFNTGRGSIDENSSSVGHQIVYFFSSEGSVDSGLLREQYLNFFPMSTNTDNGVRLVFKTYPELEKFALNISEVLVSRGVYLLSAQEYNSAITECSKKEEFSQIFLKFGKFLENVHISEKNHGFFSKLFN